LFVLFQFFEITLNPKTMPTLSLFETRVLNPFKPHFFALIQLIVSCILIIDIMFFAVPFTYFDLLRFS